MDPIVPESRGSRLSLSAPRKVESLRHLHCAREVPEAADVAASFLTGSEIRCGARSTDAHDDLRRLRAKIAIRGHVIRFLSRVASPRLAIAVAVNSSNKS